MPSSQQCLQVANAKSTTFLRILEAVYLIDSGLVPFLCFGKLYSMGALLGRNAPLDEASNVAFLSPWMDGASSRLLSS
eukprot:scaffold319_cov362-Pavlova_lutheri.AAC.6